MISANDETVTRCRIGKVRWKRHSTATALPSKRLETTVKLAAAVEAGRAVLQGKGQ